MQLFDIGFYHRRSMGFKPLDEKIDSLESLLSYQPTNSLRSTDCQAEHRAHFSLSTNVQEMQGITFVATSSTSKQSIVAINAMSPATRAWTKTSFNALLKASTNTLRFVLYPSVGPIRPMRMHVFVRMDASGSICIFARCRRSSLFIIRSLNCPRL